jgi:hypothetical protein
LSNTYVDVESEDRFSVCKGRRQEQKGAMMKNFNWFSMQNTHFDREIGDFLRRS